MIEQPTIGQRVSYEDMANPLRVGTIVRENRQAGWPLSFTVKFDNGDTTASDLRQHGWKIARQMQSPRLPKVTRAAAKAVAALEERNAVIRAAYADGVTLAAIAAAAGLSRQRVHQIVHAAPSL